MTLKIGLIIGVVICVLAILFMFSNITPEESKYKEDFENYWNVYWLNTTRYEGERVTLIVERKKAKEEYSNFNRLIIVNKNRLLEDCNKPLIKNETHFISENYTEQEMICWSKKIEIGDDLTSVYLRYEEYFKNGSLKLDSWLNVPRNSDKLIIKKRFLGFIDEDYIPILALFGSIGGLTTVHSILKWTWNKIKSKRKFKKNKRKSTS